MSDPPLFICYKKKSCLDPYVTCVASDNRITVTGDYFGTLKLLREGNDAIEVLSVHYGSINTIQVKKVKGDERYFVVCGTSLGNIYIHLLDLERNTFKTLFKYRMNHSVISLVLHPEFGFGKNINFSAPTRRIDVRALIRTADSCEWDSVHSFTDVHYSFVFALGNGVVYHLRNGGRDISILRIATFDSKCKDIMLSWYNDKVSWCDYNGVHVFYMSEFIPIIFIPFKTPIYHEESDPCEIQPITSLVTLEDSYITSDESEDDDENLELDELQNSMHRRERNGTVGGKHPECSFKEHRMMSESIRTHLLNARCCDGRFRVDFRSARVCWLDDDTLVIAYNQVIQTITILMQCVDDRSLSKGELDPLDLSDGGRLVDTLPSQFDMGRRNPFHGYISRYLEFEGGFIVSLTSHRNGIFSVLFAEDEIEEVQVHSGVSFKNSSWFQSPIVPPTHPRPKMYDLTTNGIGHADCGINGFEESMSFVSIDSCFNDRNINESFLQCLKYDKENDLVINSFTNLTCRIDGTVQILWKQKFSIYSIKCGNYNFDHFLKDCNKKFTGTLSRRCIECCNRMYKERGSMDVVTSYNSFNKTSLICRGMMIEIKECDLEEYLEQFVEHEMYCVAIWQMFKERRDGIYEIFEKCIGRLLSTRQVDVKHISYLTLLFIKCIDINNEYVNRIIECFYKFDKLNILLGYVLPTDLREYPHIYKRVIETVLRNERKNNYIILRIVASCHIEQQYLNDFLEILKGNLQETGLDNLKLGARESPLDSFASDFELLGKYLSKGGVLQVCKNGAYGPKGMAGLLALGLLLYKYGHLERAFKYLLLAKSPLVFNVASRMYDLDKTREVIDEIEALYSIDIFKANKIFVNVRICNFLDEVITKLDDKYLNVLIDSLYTNDILPLGYYYIQFKYLLLYRIKDVFPFIKAKIFRESKENIKRSLNVLEEVIRRLVQEEVKDILDVYNFNENPEQSSAPLNDRGDNAKNVKYLTSSVNRREGMDNAVSDLLTKDSSTITSFERLCFYYIVEMYIKTLLGLPISNILKILKVRYSLIELLMKLNDGLVSYVNFYRNIEVSKYMSNVLGTYKEVIGCDLARLRCDYINVKYKGVLFNINHSMKCNLCCSINVGNFEDYRNILIIKALSNKLDTAKTLKFPKDNKTLLFLCGHAVHEYCQIKLINYAIQFANSIKQNARGKLHEICLICLEDKN